ncbi:MAG: hypothetical protein C5B56_00105 [Proteobacteria bacterium]|nr:MAG: hypothetical protein C5B56_00105 [Pseudomonadota bacterium]
MSSEAKDGRKDFGALEGCFVDGDAEQRARQKKVRRRALVLSVTVQSVLLAAVSIAPLFATPERITPGSDVFIPIPPYTHHAAERGVVTQVERQRTQKPCWLCPPQPIPAVIKTRVISTEGPSDSQPFDGAQISLKDGLIRESDSRKGPARPEVNPPADAPKIVHVTHLDPAMLIRRVEPVYPALAQQTRREGRVELHAIIATDGTVQALEVVSGDVLFYRSAMEAVEQWRYRPTILNGLPVQVDTIVTVIYTLPH